MVRNVRGTRHDDGHLLVQRSVVNVPIFATVTTVLAWVAFAVAAVKCVLAIPHP